MAERLTAEILADLPTPADPQISPDGRWLVASVGPNAMQDEQPVAALWIADTTGKRPARKISTGLAEDTMPRWSPNGNRIAFLSDRKTRGTKQLQLLAFDGGEAQPLTDELGGIATFCWLPDGDRIACLVVDAEDPDEVKRRTEERDDPYVYGAFWPFARLAIIDIAAGETRKIDTGNRHIRSLNPSPDGQKLAVTMSELPTIDSGFATSEICLIDLSDTSTESLARPGKSVADLLWSNDGTTLYYIADAGPTQISSSQIWSLDVEPGSGTVLLTGDLPACIRSIARGRNDSAILATVIEGVESAIYRLDPSSNAFVKLSHYNGDLSGLSVCDDGSTVGMLGSTATHPFELFAGPTGGQLQRVSCFNADFDEIEFGPQEVITWERAGFTLDGILIWPPGNSRNDGPLPTAVSIHGGPYGRWPNAFGNSRPFGHWLAAHGYLVFQPNPRGGAGHGQKFAEAVLDTVGNEDYLDIMAGVDEIISQGIGDPDRMVCGGWSQGGFMTAWIVGHTDRFKCGVMGAGISDWGMMIATSDIESYETRMGGGNPYHSAGPHSFDAQSPISYVHKCTTPVLIIHGEEDERVPVSQAIFFHRGLQKYGVEHELVIYPREPHGIRERNHVIDQHNRIVSWYQRWIPVEDE